MAAKITPHGFQALVDEYDELLKVERPIITREVAYAASLGDRSDNAEYRYGKQRLRKLDGRLHFLKTRLHGVEVVDPMLIGGDTVRFGATVVFEDEDSGDERRVQIVGPDELDTVRGKVSYLSPLGSAFIGMQEGDAVTIATPQGPRVVILTEVLWI